MPRAVLLGGGLGSVARDGVEVEGWRSGLEAGSLEVRIPSLASTAIIPP